MSYVLAYRSHRGRPSARAPEPTVFLPIKFGEQVPGATDNSGDGNVLLIQPGAISVAGTLQYMAFHSTIPAGNLRLGLYDASDNIVVQTASFAVVEGWNIQPVSPVEVSPGTFGWAHNPSSSSMHYGLHSGVGGPHRLVAHPFGTLPSSWPGGGSGPTAGHWAAYCTVLIPAGDLPDSGFISYFTNEPLNWTDPTIIDTELVAWYNHTAGPPALAHSVTQISDYELRFEEKTTDPEVGDGITGFRSEISSGYVIAPSDLIHVSWDYKYAAAIPGPWATDWLTLFQCHGDLRPCWMGFEPNTGNIYLTVNDDFDIDERLWVSPAPLTPNQFYNMELMIKRSPSTPDGFVKLWLDGVLVADFTGIRVGGIDNYIKFGCYMGFGAKNFVCNYKNINVRIPA